MPLRILHIIHSIDPAGGGPIETVTQLGLEHQRLGRNVEIVTLDGPDAPWLATFPLRYHALGPGRMKYGYTPRLVPWLRAHAADYDIVIVNGLWQYSSFGVWRALRGKTPYVVFPHGMLDPWFKHHYPLKHLKKWLYWPWAEYRVLRDAAGVCFTTEDERVLARQSFWLYRCNELVVGYGTARPAGDRAQQQAAFLARFPGAANARVLLFLGRLHEKKGCELLLEAFGAALRSRPADRVAWRLVMAGPPAEEAYGRRLRRIAEDHCPADAVIWAGMLTGDLKWGAFHAADAFILPSHQENFGVAVAEALACRLPVLLSNKVNIWREVVSAGSGFVEPDDREGTQRLLDRWMALDEATRDEMRRRAAACFEQFDAPQVAARLGLVLETLVNDAR